MTSSVEAILDAYGAVRDPVGRRVGVDYITDVAAQTIEVAGGVADNVEYRAMEHGLSHKQPGDTSKSEAIFAVGKSIETAVKLSLYPSFEDMVEETSSLYETHLNQIRAHYSKSNRGDEVHALHELRRLANKEHWPIYTCSDDLPGDLFEDVLMTKPHEAIDRAVDEDLWHKFSSKLDRGRVSKDEQTEVLVKSLRSMAACGNVFTVDNKEAFQRGLNDMRSFSPTGF